MLANAFANVMRLSSHSTTGSSPNVSDSARRVPNTNPPGLASSLQGALRSLGDFGEKLQEAQEETRRRQYERMSWIPSAVTALSLPRFEYDTLPSTGCQEIRLLRLLPTVSDEAGLVRAELTTYDNGGALAYTALSYTWGEPAEYPIVMNGKLWRVRANLLAFLHQVLQEPNHIGTHYWIDAICINQSDVTERSTFVARMKETYEKARNIIVWLGPGAGEVESSFDALDALTKLHVFTDDGLRYAPLEDENVHARQDLPVLKERLLSHPYFSRVWILQEASTPKRVTPSWVWYSSRKRMFNEFILGLMNINKHWREQRQNIGLHPSSPLELLGDLSIQRDSVMTFMCPPITMMGLLEHARACKCTDDRNRIYALLAIALDGEGIVADYKKSITDVFLDLAQHMIAKDGSLDFLCFTDGRRLLEDLPSWVPDWTQTTVPHPFPKTIWTKDDPDPAFVQRVKNKEVVATVEDARALWRKSPVYTASKGLQASPSFFTEPNQRGLVLRGYIFDHFVSIDSGSIFGEFCEDGHEDYEHHQCSRVDALKTTCLAGVAASGILGMHTRTSWSTPDNGPVGIDPLTAIRLQMSWRSVVLQSIPGVKETIANRSLFVTSLGFIGLGSDSVQPGDILCMVAGAQMPLVLRAYPKGDHVFEFCGEAYVHGLMDGEAAVRGEECQPQVRDFSIR